LNLTETEFIQETDRRVQVREVDTRFRLLSGKAGGGKADRLSDPLHCGDARPEHDPKHR